VEGFVEDTTVGELSTLGVPVIADIGSGLVDVSCPWLGGPPPAWLAGEPAAVQTLDAGAALVTFSGDKLFAGPQAGIIAGRADLVARCAAHPLARALRPGGLVLGALQHTALAYLHRDLEALPFWKMVAVPVETLHQRAEQIVATCGVGSVRAMDALPGAGSAPGVTMPSAGITVEGEHVAVLRAYEPPVIARSRDGVTALDLRAVAPNDDPIVADALAALDRR
jgi:L-seryl-tRNA(Ser) seleniumtransferase